jgi:biotin carboxyl carrier protein
MLGRVMKGATAVRLLVSLCAVAMLSTGCVSLRELAGYAPQNDPSVTLRPSEPKWLLIKNPRFGDVPSEPEYVWVEEDKVPITFKRVVFGKSSLIAPPEIVAKYGSPPGRGRISPQQGGPYKLENVAPAASAPRGPVAAAPSATRTDAAAAPVPAPTRGYVVFVDQSRVVIDLTAGDGVKPGTTVSLRRDKITIVHPITGELLGELDEEIASGKVVEVRDKFSVVEIQSLPSGAQVKVKDRVVVR